MVKILGRSLHGSDHWDCVSKVCKKGQEKKKSRNVRGRKKVKEFCGVGRSRDIPAQESV